MKASISDDIRQAIALKAYYLWEADGRPHGKEHEHWAQAEAEILSLAPVKKAAKKAITKEPVALAATATAKEVAPKKPSKTAVKKASAKAAPPKAKKAAKPKSEKN